MKTKKLSIGAGFFLVTQTSKAIIAVILRVKLTVQVTSPILKTLRTQVVSCHKKTVLLTQVI